MKKFNKKSLAMLICAAVLLTFTVSGTVAYLVADTDELVNTFTPPTVGTEIEEKFENNVKSEIVVENTGTIPMYVRVAVIGNWVKDENGKKVIVEPANLSQLGFQLNTGYWTENGGYYYYNTPVAAGSTTENLLTGKGIKAEVRADGSYLVVTVIHQSIQAEGMNATGPVDAFNKAAQ